MSGFEFDHILDAIRPILQARDWALADEIYEPVVEGGMDFISVESLSPESYGVFCESAREAYARHLEANPTSPFKRAWSELLDSLSADPRAQLFRRGG